MSFSRFTLLAGLVAWGATIPGGGWSPGPLAAAERHEASACMHCGATCDLRPICRCEPGTKKTPRTEYEVDCKPICLPSLGSDSGGPACGRVGCAACEPGLLGCPGTIRCRKTLRKQIVEDETCVIERRVAWVCASCAGEPPSGCTGSPPPGRTWWSWLFPWAG